MMRTFAATRPPSQAPKPRTAKPTAQPNEAKSEPLRCVTKDSASNAARAATPHHKYTSRPPSHARGATTKARAKTTRPIEAARPTPIILRLTAPLLYGTHVDAMLAPREPGKGRKVFRAQGIENVP